MQTRASAMAPPLHTARLHIPAFVLTGVLLAGAVGTSAVSAEDRVLQRLRDDVREEPPSRPSHRDNDSSSDPFDIYPAKPWVLSAAPDLGTLGHASLFRIRTTAGILVRGVELYTGYEYNDVSRFHSHGLVAGLRIWF